MSAATILLPLLVALTSAVVFSPVVPFSPTSVYKDHCGLGAGEDVCSGRRGRIGFAGALKRLGILKERLAELKNTEKEHSSSAWVIRPSELPKPAANLPELSPELTVDACSYRATLVTPAVVPKPPCPAYFPPPRPLFSNIVKTGSKDATSSIPADPVSLTLAYNKAKQQNSNSQEHKITFGFSSLPKDVSITPKPKIVINEGDLYQLRGPVVELKEFSCGSTKTVEEEAEEELLAVEDEFELEESFAGKACKEISLGELGYGPARIPTPTFVDVPTVHEAHVPSEAVYYDGFRPGNVVVMKVPKSEAFRAPEAEVCETAIPVQPVVVAPSRWTNPSVAVYASSSSSSSTSTQKEAQNILLRSVGCA